MGCSLAHQKWDIRFHFNGRNPVKCGIYERDISFLTLRSLIAGEGYGESAYMYYVKEDEIGFEGVKYLATGRDGNNNIFLIAFGVVDKQDSDRWIWFLTQLRCCIGSGRKFGTYTIISDRQKGLLKAINEVFPDSP
ncbi:MATE efflux family protein 3, chloroplastic [Hordeum vulgare]|nr:MATE efflux family protein 3, chloroplastic [Hordeum vulgare]